MPAVHTPSLAVRKTLIFLGHNIKEARLRRNLPAGVVAERAFTTRPTLKRIEEGDYGVGIGIYASVLQALGLLDHLSQIGSIASDTLGQQLASEALPKRASTRRSS
jgi:transcriptional regulator with XRE-family HTH domain